MSETDPFTQAQEDYIREVAAAFDVPLDMLPEPLERPWRDEVDEARVKAQLLLASTLEPTPTAIGWLHPHWDGGYPTLTGYWTTSGYWVAR